jgi:putative FmdB family regulatory protein
MPIYAYRCENCGHAKDVLQKVSDPVLVVCPACGEPSFKKQVTAAGFQLKGSGWYVTDFRGDGKAKPGAAPVANDGTDKGSSAADSSKPDAGGPAAASSGTPASDKSAAAPAPAPAPAAPAGSSGTSGPKPA